MTLTLQLPLVVSIAGAATDDPRLAPGLFALPVGSVSASADLSSTEQTLVSGGLVELSGEVRIRAMTIRVTVPSDHPVPRALGEIWAALRPGSEVDLSETYTARNTRTHYVHARVLSNTLTVSYQRSLAESYYSGGLEFRLLLEDEHGL